MIRYLIILASLPIALAACGSNSGSTTQSSGVANPNQNPAMTTYYVQNQDQRGGCTQTGLRTLEMNSSQFKATFDINDDDHCMYPELLIRLYGNFTTSAANAAGNTNTNFSDINFTIATVTIEPLTAQALDQVQRVTKNYSFTLNQETNVTGLAEFGQYDLPNANQVQRTEIKHITNGIELLSSSSRRDIDLGLTNADRHSHGNQWLILSLSPPQTNRRQD